MTAFAILQVLLALFFVSDILSAIIPIRTTPLSWQAREALEIGAAISLIIGAVFGATAIIRSRKLQADAEASLRLASGAFMEVIQERFEDWGLTPAERDVALFAIKGMNTSEIAMLRQTSAGPVKAQTNAIYRKAGVSGRPQLLSMFIEDLLGEGLEAPSSPED